MKLKSFLPICAAVVLVGCSSDDSSNLPEENTSNYFPMSVGNSWSYNNERSVAGETTQSQETMSVAGSMEENGTTYYDLNSDNTVEAGLTTSVFSRGELAKINGKLIYSGNYAINIPGFDPIELPIDNIVVFSSSASAGTELSNFSDSMEQEITYMGETIPVSINYTVSTANESFLPTYTVGTEEFTDVLQANLLVTASVTGSLGPVEIFLMAEQNVLTISNYYANGVGLISSNATISYEFEDLPEFGFELPNLHMETSQEIDVYTVL